MVRRRAAGARNTKLVEQTRAADRPRLICANLWSLCAGSRGAGAAGGGRPRAAPAVRTWPSSCGPASLRRAPACACQCAGMAAAGQRARRNSSAARRPRLSAATAAARQQQRCWCITPGRPRRSPVWSGSELSADWCKRHRAPTRPATLRPSASASGGTPAAAAASFPAAAAAAAAVSIPPSTPTPAAAAAALPARRCCPAAQRPAQLRRWGAHPAAGAAAAAGSGAGWPCLGQGWRPTRWSSSLSEAAGSAEHMACGRQRRCKKDGAVEPVWLVGQGAWRWWTGSGWGACCYPAAASVAKPAAAAAAATAAAERVRASLMAGTPRPRPGAAAAAAAAIRPRCHADSCRAGSADGRGAAARSVQEHC